MTTATHNTPKLGGRLRIYDERDLEMLADVADEFGCSLACLMRECAAKEK